MHASQKKRETKHGMNNSKYKKRNNSMKKKNWQGLRNEARRKNWRGTEGDGVLESWTEAKQREEKRCEHCSAVKHNSSGWEHHYVIGNLSFDGNSILNVAHRWSVWIPSLSPLPNDKQTMNLMNNQFLWHIVSKRTFALMWCFMLTSCHIDALSSFSLTYTHSLSLWIQQE